MAGSIKLAAPLGGSVTLNAVDTASNFVMTVPAAAGVLINADSATGAAQLPVGTTAQRPASPVVGQLRFNSTTGATEVYNGTVWVAFTGIYSVEALLVAGGGGSNAGDGYTNGPTVGAGAGGFVHHAAFNFSLGTTYNVVVGAGGAGGGGPGGLGVNGSNSTLSSSASTNELLLALGGGRSRANGGCGGGGNGQPQIPSQGFAGSYGGGGTAQVPTAFNGGNGKVNPITGSTAGQLSGGLYYLGGGGGCGYDYSGQYAGAGGLGGGGGASTAGTVNTGGGGGGPDTGYGSYPSGLAGGSGVVILSIPSVNYTGSVTGSPSVIVNGSKTILRFNSSGSYTA